MRRFSSLMLLHLFCTPVVGRCCGHRGISAVNVARVAAVGGSGPEPNACRSEPFARLCSLRLFIVRLAAILGAGSWTTVERRTHLCTAMHSPCACSNRV